jgi:hypothetical protein
VARASRGDSDSSNSGSAMPNPSAAMTASADGQLIVIA